jgi:uncharacterized protein (TIGR02466 family)
MSEELKIFNLFPIAILDDRLNRELTKKELAFFQKLSMKKNMGNWRSENSYVLDSSEMKSLKKYIEHRVNLYFKGIYSSKNKDLKLKITQSWTNIASPGEWHHRHRHPNSFLSGVFYISAGEKDTITFYNPIRKDLVAEPEEYNIWNSEIWKFNVSSLSLIVFPSSLEHMVDPAPEDESREKRISLAFNCFPNGTLGERELLNELIVESKNG